VRAETGRLTLTGARTAPFAVADLNLVARLNARLRASLLTENLLDAAYAYPGGVEHLQDAIAQDGRKLELRLEYVW
jgi:iron complex outermembrane receptor protein